MALRHSTTAAAIGGLMFFAAATSASAGGDITHNTDVTPDVIFGDGNANGGFTIDGSGGDVELGLRAKLRYDNAGLPQNVFPTTGGGQFNFSVNDGNPPAGRSIFNFEWSVNTDVDDSNSISLDFYEYELSIDYDPSPAVGMTNGVDVIIFDPINQPYVDNAIGDNSTGNGDGTVAPRAGAVPTAAEIAEYQALIANNNVAQNSWNLGFFEPAGFDPQTPGIYTITLAAFDRGRLRGSTSIDVTVSPIPVPAALPLMASALAAFGFAGWRRRQRQA